MNTYYVLFLLTFSLFFNFNVASQTDTVLTEQHFKKILDHNKKSAYANIGLASLCFRNGEYEQAAFYAENCIALHTDYEEEAWLLLGTALDLQKQITKSIGVFEKAALLFPQNYLIWYNLAFLHYKNKDYEKSLVSLDSTLIKQQGFQDGYILKSIILYEKENNPQAVMWAMYGIMLNPKNELSLRTFSFMLKILYKKHADIQLPDIEQRRSMLGVVDILNSINTNESIITQLKTIEIEKYLIETDSYFRLNVENVNSINRADIAGFFKKMINAGHLAAFEYYILQTACESKALEWFKMNPSKMKAFADWLEQN